MRASWRRGSTIASSSRSPICCRWSTIPRSSSASCGRLDVPASDVRHPAVLGRISPQPAAGAARGRFPAHAHGQADQGRAAGSLPAHPHHVDGVPERARLREPRGAGPGHRDGVARRAEGPARCRRLAGPVRRARPVGGGVQRRQERPQLHVRRALGIARAGARTRLRARPGQRRGRGNARASASRCMSAAATGRPTNRWRWPATTAPWSTRSLP